jgi:hypothetical protein
VAYRRIAYKKEPVLNLHRYICAIITATETKYDTNYRYCLNLKEVNEAKRALKPGQIMEVYRASHNFIKACERIS